MMQTSRFFACIGFCVMAFLASCNPAGSTAGQSAGNNPIVDSPMLVTQPRQGLAGLARFQMSAVNEFNGTVNGKVRNTRLELQGDLDQKNNAGFVLRRETGSDGKIQEAVEGVFDGASYSRNEDGKATCHSSWDPEESRMPSLWPVDVLPGVNSGANKTAETINGVKASHYKLDAGSFGMDGKDVQGDVWIADSGGYVVKLTMTVKGGEAVFGKDREGTQTLTYELTGINSTDPVKLPEGCLPVLTNIPLMPDASNVYRVPDFLRYDTKSTGESVLEFYRKELAAKGWQGGDVHPNGSDGQILSFTHSVDPDGIHISVTKGTGVQMVSVSKVRAPLESEKSEAENNPAPQTIGEPIEPAKAGLPADVPIYTGAKDFTGIEGRRLEFSVTDPVEKVKEFYSTVLKKAGWSLMAIPSATPESPQMFRKGSQVIVIQLTSLDKGTSVAITKAK